MGVRGKGTFPCGGKGLAFKGGVVEMKDNEKSLSKIDKVFDRIKENGIVFVEDHAHKKNLSDSTNQTYRSVMKHYSNYLHEQGVKDIGSAKPRHAYEFFDKQIEKYQAGEVSAWSLRLFPHAIHALQEASKQTGVFAGKLRLGNKQEMLGKLNDLKIYRESEDSKSLKANREDWEKVQTEILKSRSSNAKIAADMHRVGGFLGARVHEAVKIKAEDVKIAPASATVTITGKGGLVRVIKTEDPKTVELLRERMEGKKPGAPLFPILNKQGNDKTLKAAQKFMKDTVRAAALRANVDRDGKTYGTHSARKAFAQERMNQYASMSKTDLKREADDRRRQNQGLDRKYKKTLQDMRNKLAKDSPNRSRDLNHKELCKWLVSVDLGHGRMDVVRYYCNYPGSKN